MCGSQSGTVSISVPTVLGFRPICNLRHTFLVARVTIDEYGAATRGARDMPSEGIAGQRRAKPWRTAARHFGNVFLGVAAGLLGYYAVTNLVTAQDQRVLGLELPALAASAPPAVGPTSGDTSPTLDFTEWAEQDAVWWNGRREGQALARIVAPTMGLDAFVVKGTVASDLKRGPGWITYTQMPGPSGNCGISGHRTTYGAPFRHLDQLKPGDTIDLYTPYRQYTYKVRRVFAVAPNRVDVVGPTASPTLTMTACHPPYSARQRLIAQSDLIEVRRLEKPGAGATP